MFKRLWNFNYLYVFLLVFSSLQTIALFFYSKPVFYVSLGLFCILFCITMVRIIASNRHLNFLIKSINDDLQSTTSNALTTVSLPVIIVSGNDEIIWYNNYFEKFIDVKADSLVGNSIASFLGEENYDLLKKTHRTQLSYKGRFFDIYETVYNLDTTVQHILFFVDSTDLKNISLEYKLSRPVVAFIAIDNLDDIAQNLRDSERSTVSSRIQMVLEDWFATANGISRRLSGDRYLFVFEKRDLNTFVKNKFDILQRVRDIDFKERGRATVSIGIGHGNNLKECEEQASQALDMALGRGGDQVAVKNEDNSFKFFGGISGANEKRSRVRARIVASALTELIENSEQVVLMGHKYADLDCYGAAFALCSAIRKKGKKAFIAANKETMLVKPLLNRISALGADNYIKSCGDLYSSVDKQTLLIILDTHRPSLAEDPHFLDLAGNTVVIDHHRKSVDYIQNATIFYHETAASSACEMVSELLQYISESSVTRIQAEAMLAGIMLDTRNYCIHTGVRTFEASAFLRKKGADPIIVKKLFADSMEACKAKNTVIASAESIGCFAVAVNDNTDLSDDEIRVTSSQAADELLNITGIKASFVISRLKSCYNISARSYGEINVQLIMEELGGGGHRTMAACQLDSTIDLNQAKQKLIGVLDQFLNQQ